MNPARAGEHMKRLFSEGFTALDVAERLVSFDAEKDAAQVRDILAAHGLDVAGVRVDGRVAGYVAVEDLTTDASCGDLLRSFGKGEVVTEEASLSAVMWVLSRSPFCFVAILDEVAAVVTRRDVQKPTVRMWLFGMITILEVFLTHALEERYPHESWKEEVSAGRLAKAEALLEERRRRNQAGTLLDCLQLSDKAQILVKDPDLVEAFGFKSRSAAKKAVKDLESLRNNLAHSQDIVTHDWEFIIALVRRMERIIAGI